MATATQKNLVEKNAEYASKIKKGQLSDLPAGPLKKFLILTCMDGRIEPMDAFGLSLDDAHIVRNGGGNARDAMRPIVISEQMLGTREILVIKHTDCGFTYFDNKKAHDTCLKNLGPEAKEELDDMDFGPITDLDEAVRQDVKYLRDSKLIQKDVVVSGWVHDLETGKVRKVD